MRDLQKALLVTAVSAAVVIASLAVAYSRQMPVLTSGDLQRIARGAIETSVEAAIDVGGLGDAVDDVETRVRFALGRAGFSSADVRVVRRNDFDALAAFSFDVEAGGVAVRVSVEGLIDPLWAMHLGEERLVRRQPIDPYASLGSQSTLEGIVSGGYYHHAQGAPDIFARLENRTSDPYHFGLETFLSGEPLTLDHVYFRTGQRGLSREDADRYGLG